ncbi:hypothetical protein [Krasilnikovia sp. M28-CT-15]|uniref:hypothetical protein n=1 Tax=Krasilnikovia sp. M28-CT-15 TaxID=3373540 RepID=UPI0038775731
MTAVRELTHTPLLPSYDCSCCGAPWPCGPAKVELFEEMRLNRIHVVLYLGAHLRGALDEAISDHDWSHVDNLYERFVGWTKRPPTQPDATR